MYFLLLLWEIYKSILIYQNNSNFQSSQECDNPCQTKLWIMTNNKIIIYHESYQGFLSQPKNCDL